jgi:hypothetical protein
MVMSVHAAPGGLVASIGRAQDAVVTRRRPILTPAVDAQRLFVANAQGQALLGRQAGPAAIPVPGHVAAVAPVVNVAPVADLHVADVRIASATPRTAVATLAGDEQRQDANKPSRTPRRRLDTHDSSLPPCRSTPRISNLADIMP